MKIDFTLLETILRKDQTQLKQMLRTNLQENGYKTQNAEGFLYAPGDVPVLLVVHLDTVHDTPLRDICYSQNQEIVMSPQGIGGDDRAGVYMVLQIIQKVRCHVLFCEDEEFGCRGAMCFVRSAIRPQVNFIVGLDRCGADDAVFYDCMNEDFIEFVENFGFRTATGSFSDISVIAPHLETAAVNISAGYYHEHTLHEHINLAQMAYNIERISKMVQSDCGHFRYIGTRSGGWNMFGEQLPIWDTFYEEEYMELMPLPEDAYIKVHGERVDYCHFPLLSADNKVYGYIEELGAAIPVSSASAFTADQNPIEFQKEEAIRIPVISTNEAIYRLGG